MAACVAGGGGGGEGDEELGELSEALRAEIEEAVGEKTADFYNIIVFGDAAAVFLAEKLRGNAIVERLWLRFCRIGAVGARALAEAVGEDNTTLKELDLFQNSSLADDGAQAMALMLRKNTTLEQLGLSACGVGGRGARALAEALKENHTLKGIFINSNQIGDDCANALAEALRWNESLEDLRLGDCRLTHAGASCLLSALRESNSTLISLWLVGNYGIENSAIKDSITELLEENRVVVPETAERRARCLLFCCLQLAPTAHEHVVPSIGAVPVPVMQYAVEHAGKLHVAKRFEQGNLVADAGLAPRHLQTNRPGRAAAKSPSLEPEPATSRRRR